MIMPLKSEMSIRATDGQVDDMVLALIEAAYDKDVKVRAIICASLLQLGRKQPALVLSSCHAYLVKHAKLPQGHRVVILNTMESVIRETLEEIDQPLAVDLVKLASSEMTETKEVVPEWQTAASGMLVALGCRFCNEVMEEMMIKFQPGILPHFFVVQTMANLATANVYGMVPFLKGTLGTMLPMLGMAKMDNMRWVLSSALAKFCEAILDYVANIEKAPDKSVKKEFFAAEIYAAHDVLFNVWLQSREAKLRLAIVDALGQMVHIMSRDKLQEQLPKILPGILTLYRKHNEQYHITQGMCMILDAATEGGSMMLEPYFENLLGALFPQVCQPLDYNNPMTIKNHYELLRCFAVLAKSFSEKIVAHLLLKLEPVNDKVRIGVLAILRHLINAAALYMSDKQALVLSGLKIVLPDPSNKVKKVLAQTIIAMAHHGYLDLDGGELMIEFIVRQCALPPEPPGKRPNDPDYVSNEALRSMCENVLHLLSSTVENMDLVLWPYLLECLVPEMYTEALGPLCRAIGQIAERKREANHDDYYIDFDKQVNVKKPPELFARLLVMLGWPTHGKPRGMHILHALKSMGPLMHENLAEMWDTVIPKLIQHFEDAENSDDGLSQKNWEDLILKFVAKSLDQVDDEDWVFGVGKALGEHVNLYKEMSREKSFLYKCLGVVLRKSKMKDFVNQQLDLIFTSVRHSNEMEREGCAIAVGFTAASHLDSVLTKLEMFGKNDPGKKSSGFLGFLKDSLSGPEVDGKMKATLMLSYGFVTLYAPPGLIVSRMEAVVMRVILPQLANVKDSSVKMSLIRAVELIGRAMQPEHLKTRHTLEKRGELLQYMLKYIQLENKTYLTNDTRALAMDACAKLIKLRPKLSEAEVLELLRTCLGSVLSLSVETKRGKEERYEEHMERELLLTTVLLSLEELLLELLNKDLTAEALDNIFKQLEPWLTSVEDCERDRAITVSLCLLKHYLEKVDVVASGHFSNYGSLLARLVPRCSDPSVRVRQSAVDCVHVVLKIALKYEGKDDTHQDQMVDAMPTLRERLDKADAAVLFSVINDLSKVLSKKIPGDQLMTFLETLFDGLLDPQAQSSSGACVVLKTIVKNRGGELHSQVGKVLPALHERLDKITNPQTKVGTLRAIRSLSTHHLNSVISVLLEHPLPFDQMTNECWQVMGEDPTLTEGVIDLILSHLSRCLPYEEKLDPRDRSKTKMIKVATLQPLLLTCALTEVCKPEEAEVTVMNHYPRLLAAMMVRISSTVAAKPPSVKREDGKGEREVDLDPCQSSIDGCQQVIVSAKCVEYLETLQQENVWTLLGDQDKYQEGFSLMARYMVTTQPQFVSKVIPHLTPVLSSMYDSQRVMAAAFFAELIEHKCAGDLALVEMLVNGLLGRLVDTCQVVRMLCIRGLGNVASVGSEQLQKYSTTVLSAMMAGMDDKDDMDDDITLEAMNGLSKVLAEIDENHIRAILINISLRIRPCFEKDKSAVRAASITLFGNLSRFGDGPSKEPFLEQIHTNMVSLLLHLNDKETEVREASKHSLRLLGPLVGSDSMDQMFKKHLIEGATLHYGEFINDLAKVIIQDFPDKLNFYVMGNVTFFKSNCEHIRSNAAMFTGFLLGNMPVEKYTSISKEHVCNALVLLLKDSKPEVRIKASEAISWLYNL